MSGGHFDYKQFHIDDIINTIKDLIVTNKDEDLNKYGEIKGRHYSEETIKKFEKTIQLLEISSIMVKRIDWLVCGDDSEETFHDLWKENLNEFIRKENKKTNKDSNK